MIVIYNNLNQKVRNKFDNVSKWQQYAYYAYKRYVIWYKYLRIDILRGGLMIELNKSGSLFCEFYIGFPF